MPGRPGDGRSPLRGPCDERAPKRHVPFGAVSRVRAASVRVNHAVSSSQGKCPGSGLHRQPGMPRRDWHTRFRGDSPTSYSPASNGEGT